MKLTIKKKLLFAVLVLVIGVGAIAGFSLWQELSRVASNDPLVWQDSIADLVRKTEAQQPTEQAVLFVGSSSIRFWNTLAEDMSPLPVIQHGFGGAKIVDVVYFAEDLITRWKPAKVVIFVGANDINGNEQHHLAPEHIAKQLTVLLDIIFAANPNTEVFYIAITPTLFSWDKWESVQKANHLAEQVCANYKQVSFIDPTDLFLNEAGTPNKHLFLWDGLHLNEQGYAVWTSHIKPYLLKD